MIVLGNVTQGSHFSLMDSILVAILLLHHINPTRAWGRKPLPWHSTLSALSGL